MRFTVYTLFPGLIESYLEEALLARARKAGIVEVVTRDLRRFAGNRTGRVDDAPYGGGAGMVMRVDVAAAALDEARADDPPPDETILLTPAGERLDQDLVTELATRRRHVVVLSGRYEGFDARVEGLVTREVSLGDFVLMGGELPALVLIEAVTRLLPGALGDADSHRQESFTTGLLDYPEYTRPPLHEGVAVPETLLSGHHGKVETWRREAALRRTFERRPDLLDGAPLTEAERALLAAWAADEGRAGPD